MTIIKGTRYGLPFAGDALCMVYKPVQVAYPPTKWQELVQVNVKVMAFPVSDPLGLMQTLFYMSRGGGFGGDDTKVSLDETALQKSLLLLSDGASSNAFPTWLTDYTTFDQSWQALLNSNATYSVIWVSQYLADPQDGIMLGTLPAWEESSYTLADGWVMAFPQTSSVQFVNYQLLAEYLLDTEFQSSWSEAAGILPVNKQVLSGWKNKEVSGILLEIGNTAHPLPNNFILSKIGPLFNQATIEMIRKQTTYIESSNKILKALSE
jgi:maltose-binding protein MalE